MSIRPTVLAAWRNYTDPLEGVWASPYFDTKRLITTAAGVLADPIERCLALDWRIGNKVATTAQVRDDFKTLKDMATAMSNEELRKWTAGRQAPYTSIRLRAETIDTLVLARVHANADYLIEHYFPDFGEWSADSQLGTLSLAWAIGAGFTLTNPPRTEFVAAARVRNWEVAKVHARLRTAGNAGVVARNAQQDICFANAMVVDMRDLDPAWLWWPNRTPPDADLHTLALKALELGIARESKPPQS